MSIGQIFDALVASPITWGVLTFVALAMALSGKFSVLASDYVLVLATLLAVVAIYRAPLLLQQDLLVRILFTLLLGSAIGLGMVALSQWMHPEVQLTFKESLLFTNQVRHQMRRDITRNQDYFVRLGIQVPKDLPPIRVQTGPNSGTNGIYAPESLPNYRWEMVIGENFVNDRTAATGMYGSFVIGQLVNDPKILKQFAGNLGTFMQPLLLWQSFSEYFNASFWNKRPAAAFPWATQLWKIRDKLGSDFTDRMAAYTLMSIVDNPAEGQETNFDAMKNFNIYFYRKLKVGDSVIDNESKRWAEIVQILKADGSYTDE